jgi:hypothetical protein
MISDEITHKVAKVTEFSVFLDYLCDEDFKGDVMQDKEDLPKSINVEKLMSDTTNEIFMDILRQEFNSAKPVKHHYLIERFGLEARLKLNKKPLVNQLP